MELLAMTALALVAGAVSFSSPCVLPLLPGYVSFVSRSGSQDRGRSHWGPALFVAGFGAVFVAMGLTASAVGLLLRQNLDILTRGAGVVVVVLGLGMTGVLRIPLIAREFRPGLRRATSGAIGSFGLGAAFALGWTPCVGPVLATILTVAATSGRLMTGVVLLAAYALGLGLPFLLLARALLRGRDRFAWLRRNAHRLEVAGGVMLVVTGVLMLSGVWSAVMADAVSSYARWGWPPI
ncbi:cytochrome c biogenesis CcdA family protein [Pseudonocardia alni]|uniref:Cytochrome c-type biogenesis protein n=1 Tax=Pseudonocardia alni TaxID=33907 RepID=A0AA44UUZ5_PSEA5|nr:cytochrome c biogenesis protein CcdA [Pseudonocardia alni]NWJ75004.1 cytochrome C biogenesis protein [Pseudonocardia pini]NWJ75142.1 cytochrome C biogenesis protein [Pseudonocardia pini]PKB41167.1 cytochrome c-type biogenesis protein [Pseudonocardia alni]WFG47140.1 cytochrome C biogenesis protein [Pseudonocardia alni]